MSCSFFCVKAEPDVRALAKEPFLAGPCLISLQVGAGMALQGRIAPIETAQYPAVTGDTETVLVTKQVAVALFD